MAFLFADHNKKRAVFLVCVSIASVAHMCVAKKYGMDAANEALNVAASFDEKSFPDLDKKPMLTKAQRNTMLAQLSKQSEVNGAIIARVIAEFEDLRKALVNNYNAAVKQKNITDMIDQIQKQSIPRIAQMTELIQAHAMVLNRIEGMKDRMLRFRDAAHKEIISFYPEKQQDAPVPPRKEDDQKKKKQEKPVPPVRNDDEDEAKKKASQPAGDNVSTIMEKEFAGTRLYKKLSATQIAHFNKAYALGAPQMQKQFIEILKKLNQAFEIDDPKLPATFKITREVNAWFDARLSDRGESMQESVQLYSKHLSGLVYEITEEIESASAGHWKAMQERQDADDKRRAEAAKKKASQPSGDAVADIMGKTFKNSTLYKQLVRINPDLIQQFNEAYASAGKMQQPFMQQLQELNRILSLTAGISAAENKKAEQVKIWFNTRQRHKNTLPIKHIDDLSEAVNAIKDAICRVNDEGHQSIEKLQEEDKKRES